MEDVGRSVDIELGGQEVITIDLDNLDPNPVDILDLLREGKCKVWVWTKIAGEYWRRGTLEAADQIARTAIETFTVNGQASMLSPVYSLLASIQLTHARQAPKLIMKDARVDKLEKKAKEVYYREAAYYLNQGDRVAAEAGENIGLTQAFLTRGIHQLATRSLDEAMRSFDGVLAQKPTNVIALLGKARILYARRNYREALKLYQDVLRYNPKCRPDPRIGIGLCLWSLELKEKARAAWRRSLEVNPNEWAAQLLLGIDSINSSKEEQLTEQERFTLRKLGTEMIGHVFRANRQSAAAANILSDLMLQKKDLYQALKLAERTIQYADTLTLVTEGYIRAARVSHSEKLAQQALKYYQTAASEQPKNIIAAIGLAQMQVKCEEIPAAIHTLDTLLQAPNPQRSIEATVMLASLRASPRPGVSAADLAQDKVKARELFDRAFKLQEDVRGQPGARLKMSERIAKDLQMYAEIARLWQSDNLEKVLGALRDALKICKHEDPLYPRLLSNVGVLHHLEGNLADAQASYESALTSASSHESLGGEGISTTILYNLARLYEEQGLEEKAKEAYSKLISRHPEYADAKLRLANIQLNNNKFTDANDLIKQALTGQPHNLNLRAYNTYFLIHAITLKPSKEVINSCKEFVVDTLKGSSHDVYALCAAGWIQYYSGRENRDATEQGVKDRKRYYQRAADFYEKALLLDPMCAVAAQGLAIIIAEDALGTIGGLVGGGNTDDTQRRMLLSREALDIFAKVRESINDGSVYVNMGHCHFNREEFDRAIESYETASTRFYNKSNVSVLLYLCRAWYSKAMKDQSFTSISTALAYAEEAQKLAPTDKVMPYNIAMIQQKSAETMLQQKNNQRSLKDLQQAIDHAKNAQRLFASLAADTSQGLPYNKDMAEQRRRYGESLLKKADEQLSAQEHYESEAHAKLEAARRKRQEEKDKQEEAERIRQEQLKREAEVLAEERRKAKQEALEWSQAFKVDSDEEKERKPKKTRKPKSEPVSGDEGEPKKRRRKIKKHEETEDIMLSEEEEDQKPAKKRTAKKRVVRDEDEEEAQGPRKKQFKSREMLSDTDDEMS